MEVSDKLAGEIADIDNNMYSCTKHESAHDMISPRSDCKIVLLLFGRAQFINLYFEYSRYPMYGVSVYIYLNMYNMSRLVNINNIVKIQRAFYSHAIFNGRVGKVGVHNATHLLQRLFRSLRTTTSTLYRYFYFLVLTCNLLFTTN